MSRTKAVASAALRLLATLTPLGMAIAALANALMGRPLTAVLWLVMAFLVVAVNELSQIRAGVQKMVKFEEDASRQWRTGR